MADGAYEPKAELALQRIQDHIDACAKNYGVMADTFTEVRDSIKSTNRILQAFIAFVVATVVTFAGYTYTQDQSLNVQMTDAKVAASIAAANSQKIPDETANKIAKRFQGN